MHKRRSKNKRTRSSLWLRWKGTSLLIDTATEFRLQALQAGLQQVDGVLYTHCHADHVFGFDDLRVFSRLTESSVCLFTATPPPLLSCGRSLPTFSVKRSATRSGPGLKPTWWTGLSRWAMSWCSPCPCSTDTLPIFGYRIGNLAYITDCSHIPPASLEMLRDLDLLILGVVGFNPHHPTCIWTRPWLWSTSLNPNRPISPTFPTF